MIGWRHSDEPAAVTVREPVTKLTGSVEVAGDSDLLDYYLELVSFG
ncbi:hypothetical protein AB0L70_28470 [Kribbella sp. NPDC051952]